MSDQPVGTVTFLFSDIQGSTRLLHEIGDAYAGILAEHRQTLRAAFNAHHGVEVGTEGDSFFVAFIRASDALAAAVAGQRGLASGPVRVRMGLHCGEPLRTSDGYVGMAVHRAARIAAVGHGGQILLSHAVATLVRDHLPDSVELRDLGAIRLRDLASPEHLYQALHPELPKAFPALRSLEATPNNLPQQLTTFIGREKEIREIKALLAKTRVLTLTGSGGSGKTRLSLQVAAELVDGYPDGAWLVELAALADPNLVPQAVASVLGVKEEPRRPLLDTLAESLRQKQLIVLLDNCEHVLEVCMRVADALARHCPSLKILASSREPLGISGEQTYRVPSLSLPDRKGTHTPQRLSQYESARLFIDRALLVRPDFQIDNQNAPALASLCCHLDGIPLAIELAAARVRTLSVDEIDQKLDHRFRLLTGGSRTALPRQQTLRSLIDWSYNLLHNPEKKLLERLSVFAGGWTYDAAEQVCSGEGIEDTEALDVLTMLADKSLVVAEQSDGHSRYRLLETVRHYAADKLVESGDFERIRERHRAFYMALAERAAPKLTGSEQGAWLRRLEDERENLRAALDASLVNTTEGLRLCGALARFWWTRGHLAEGREWCARALAKVGPDVQTAEHASALNAAGVLAYYQGDYAASRTRHQESLAIRRHVGDRRGISGSLSNLGALADAQGDYPAARALHEESLAIMRELGDPVGLSATLNNVAGVALQQGDVAAAKPLNEESLAIRRRLGDQWGIANSLENLGQVAYFQADYRTARSLHQESLAIRRELGDRSGLASSLKLLADVAYEENDLDAAAALHGDSLILRRELGDRRGIADSMEGLAAVRAAKGDTLRAAKIWRAAERLRVELGSPLPPNERPRNELRVATARKAYGDVAAFECAWQEGYLLTLEQAVALALEGPSNAVDGSK